MVRSVDLVDDIEPSVRSHDAQRHGLADGVAELAEVAAGNLAQQGSHVDLTGEADELGSEEDPVLVRNAEKEALVLHRPDQAQGGRSWQAGGARERGDTRSLARGGRRAKEGDRLLHRLVQLRSLLRRRHRAIVAGITAAP